MIAVFLANGFEEIEALAAVDLLRRAGLDVVTVGVGTNKPVGAHNIPVTADITEEQLDFAALTAVVLPGGMPGTLNLEKSAVVQKALSVVAEKQLPIGAICAAPSILGHAGLLRGLHATCYPGFEEALNGAEYEEGGVVTDGETAAVLYEDDTPIPGLYAAGETSNHNMFNLTYLGGFSLGECLTFGRIAGTNAAIEALAT